MIVINIALIILGILYGVGSVTNFKEWYYQFREHTEQLAIYSFSMIVTIFFATFSYFFIESTVINYMAVYWGIVFAKRKLHREGLEE